MLEQLRSSPWLLRVLTVLALASFIWLLFREEAFWNIIAEAWGVFLAGTVAWWFLLLWEEPIQERVWLRRHRTQLRPVLEAILHAAALTANAALGLSNELQLELREGSTRESRRRAARQALELVGDMAEGRTDAARDRAAKANLLEPDVQRSRRVVQKMAAQNGALLGRLTRLQGDIQQYDVWCGSFLGTPAIHTQPAGETAELAARVFLASLGRAAITLCETCSDTLQEAGALSQRQRAQMP